MYCKYLKLTNGDNLIVQTDDQCSTFENKEFINVVDPVLINSMRFPRGQLIVETFVMQPWLRMAKQDVISIPTKSIVVAVDMHERAEEQYKHFLSESSMEQELGEDNLGDESVDIESLLNGLIGDNDEEDEEDDGTRREPSGRILH